ncbi:MAG TPA: sensor domain-containing diguanylate cyclase [Candidatus Acidoferrales bacterium]|nr:sensor domain-containing diguanylate cyclase [Candidatus Acidoferrales bacterium]
MSQETVLVLSFVALLCAVGLLFVMLLRLQNTARQLRQAVEAAASARDRASVLLTVTEAVNSSLSMEEVLNLALTHCGRLVGASAGALYLMRPDRSELTREASFGLAHHARAATRRLDQEPTRSALAQERQSVVELAERDAPGLEGGGHPGHALVLPVQRSGQLMGAMELYLLNQPEITPEQMDLLYGVAAQTATAIRHAQLFREQEETGLTDELTHLPNRRYLAQRYLQEMQRSRRYHKPMAFLMLDIDHFKEVNDSHGHLIGDQVLAELGRILAASVRESDVCARYGGEEFAAILHEASVEGAQIMAERLRQGVEAHTFPAGLKLSVSVGIAATDNPERFGTLIEEADSALYRAKEAGRNRVALAQIPSAEVETATP